MIVVISDAVESELENTGDRIAKANPSPLVCDGTPARGSLGVPRGFPLVSRYDISAFAGDLMGTI